MKRCCQKIKQIRETNTNIIEIKNKEYYEQIHAKKIANLNE